MHYYEQDHFEGEKTGLKAGHAFSTAEYLMQAEGSNKREDLLQRH